MAIKDRLLGRARKARETPRKERVRKTRQQVSPTGNIGGRDPYRIGPVGGSQYGSGFVILENYDNFEYVGYELLGRGENPPEVSGKYLRRAWFQLSFKCCRTDGSPVQTARQDSIIIVDVIIQDAYASRTKAKDRGSMEYWFKNIAKETGERISDGECSDWNSPLKGCKRSINTDNVEMEQGYDEGK